MTKEKITYVPPLKNFAVVGINYRKTDANIRGNFSIPTDKNKDVIKNMVGREVNSCFILSTCNRTEIYAITKDPDILIDTLCESTQCERDKYSSQIYGYTGLEAINHLFKVASGLDSQIIGDYEILSQLKIAITIARKQSAINSLMARIINYAFQASKEIKTKTKLSVGTTSVSYAAIEIIREKIKNYKNPEILVIGAGKIGAQVTKNLIKFIPDSRVSIINRTDRKSIHLADKYNLRYFPYYKLTVATDDADIIIVNSSAADYVVHSSFFITHKKRLILDLSIPSNVDPAIANIKDTILLNVDEVSKIMNDTISRRKAEIPKAYMILNKTVLELEEWHRHQANRPYIICVKSKLKRLQEASIEKEAKDKLIHITVQSLAIQLKNKKNKGCQCILALNNYLKLEEEKIFKGNKHIAQNIK